MDLKKKTYNAFFWSFIDKGGEQLIRFLFSIVLARLLLPEYFGLLGMAFVVTEFAYVFVQSGFGLALIQNKDTDKTDECSIFYFNIFIGALCTLLIILLAPIIGIFFKSKEIVPILRVLSLCVVFSSFGTIQTVLMTKGINFKAQTRVSLPTTLLSGIVGIILAYNNFGVWSLVTQTILRTIFYSLFLWFVHPWRPSFLFRFSSLKKMFAFGSKLLMGNLVQMIFGNIYTIIIGKLFSSAQLGYYTRANQTQQLPIDTIWTVVGRVTFPVFSIIKDDKEKLKRAIAKASGSIAFLIFPFLSIGALVAPPLFRFLFGEKWTPSIPIFQILCVANLFYPLENLRNNAILAKGNASLQFKLQLFKYLSILCSIGFSFFYGLYGLLIAFAVVSYINFFINSYFVGKETGYKITSQLIDIFPYLLCTAITSASVFCVSKIVNHNNDFLLLSIETFIGFAVYIASSFLFKLNALKDNYELLHSFFPGKVSN